MDEMTKALQAEDARQANLHELLETIREQIRLEVLPEHRPEGLFQNIQNAVYAMRGRTPLMNDAVITSRLSAHPAAPVGEPQDGPCFYCGEMTSSLAGNPGKWPLIFCQPDGTGRVKYHHTSCVVTRLRATAPPPCTQKVPDIDAMIQAGLDAADLYEIASNDIITKKDLRLFLTAALSTNPGEQETTTAEGQT